MVKINKSFTLHGFSSTKQRKKGGSLHPIFPYIRHVAELHHICISQRLGSKRALKKAAKVNVNKRILST